MQDFWEYVARVLFTMQRYEFFSKSQPLFITKKYSEWCYLPCKGTNFLANHNASYFLFSHYQGVIYHAKVRIF